MARTREDALKNGGFRLYPHPGSGAIFSGTTRAAFAGLRPPPSVPATNTTPLSSTACPDLCVVSRCGVGIDSVDLAAATEAGVLVTNTPGAMTDAVADYTFALLLSAARRVAESAASVQSGGWGDYTGVLVCRKTLGLVGFGQIGQGVARRAAGFGMRILAYDPIMAQKNSLPAGLPPIEFVETRGNCWRKAISFPFTRPPSRKQSI